MMERVMRSYLSSLLSAKPVASTVCRVSFKSVVIFSFLFAVIFSVPSQAMVFVNEVFLNPPGDATDANREFIELMGTPNMKLDGYAVAVLNGTEVKYYPAGSLPPLPVDATGPEIDELFSLDGLALGDNGLLALLIGDKTPGYFEGVVPDSIWVNWNNLWNGGLDVPGKLSNNGSTTFLLIRNRPGITEADPTNSAGLLWGKNFNHDVQLFTPVWDGNASQWADQWGDGNIDKGEPNEMGGNSLDLSGLTTTSDLSDDLEIVDEVSFEDGGGWEYDTDGRHVDFESGISGFPHRHVHALDDPEGFGPDALTRVDYRTKGVGWEPSGVGTGEMTNGNNWQDTATEQWIRGNSIADTIMFKQHYFYDNASNPFNTIQPFETNVVLWLYDGTGQDYDFSSPYTYEISAGRINPLSVPFIPGDVDRDGDCDSEDIAKVSAVFGDDDWIFSNSFLDAPETDRGDPATQTKPWDVDGTGDNGIEASDMQWVLNFQGDATGQIVGVTYDSDTPASSGVVLNGNSGIECTVGTSVNIPSGRTLSTLVIGDIIEITVSGQVIAGANSTADEENGIMQFVHDAGITPAGVVRVVSVEPLSSFATTRPALQKTRGAYGDEGIDLVNGYTTSFTEGLASSAQLYRIKLQAIEAGSADITIGPSADAKFAASTLQGLKIGHTASNGNPESSVYPSVISITSASPAGDLDGDDDTDLDDFKQFAAAWQTEEGQPNWDSACNLQDSDTVIDAEDFVLFLGSWLDGKNIIPPADLDNDYKVNLTDFDLFASAWGTQEGDDNWNNSCNFYNDDFVIDVADLSLFAENWLAGCGSYQAAKNPGDITDDNCVDLADFARLGAAWLSVLGGENWDGGCDIGSPAGSIGTDDLTVLAENWLAGCGP